MTSNLAQVSKTKKMAQKIGKLSTTEQAKLQKMYMSGPAASWSARILQEASKLPKAKSDTFLETKSCPYKAPTHSTGIPSPLSNCLRN